MAEVENGVESAVESAVDNGADNGVADGAPVEWKKYNQYALEVDPDQDDKAKEIKLRNFSRPHMRAFHCSWFAFFIAFFVWFAIAPLLPEIKESLNLEKKQLWSSNIANVAGTIFMRFLLGPLCDKVGPRVLFMAVLCFASIPTGCTGFVDSANGLIVLRLFIGVAGGSFVMCQYWTSRMFTKEVVGTANALVGGWGNLGGGVTQIVMGTALFPLFKEFFKGTGSPEEIATSAWRHVCIVPAIVAFFTGIMVFLISDDAPKGNFNELKRHGTMAEVSAAASFRSGACNFNTWILFVQYGCCFGVELTMNNAAALYFHDKFDLTTENAAAAASIFGWMNLFARGLGGWSSDIMNKRMGMKGRLLTQLILLLIEGALVLVFAQSDSLGEALAVMVFFSMFVQAAEGSTYAIVPYVDPPATGSIAGIVGAGGNVGAVGFGMAFRQLDDDKDAFIIMGCVILVFALTTVLITVKGHRGILFGKDTEFPKAEAETLTVPVPNKEDKVEVTSA